jgi:hypothetical protein
MPTTFHNTRIGGIPCTINLKWTSPICGPFIVTGAPDHQGESTSITLSQIETIVKEIVPAVCRLIGGKVRYKIKGRYTCIVPSKN